MEGGVYIAPHIDAEDPPCDLIVTLCILGTNAIRVGGVEFCMGPGDVYMLSGVARSGVKHEVLSSSGDRLSVTFRFTSPHAIAEWRACQAEKASL